MNLDDGSATTDLVNVPRIKPDKKPKLKFVSLDGDDRGDRIEEGLSIQLPGPGQSFHRLGTRGAYLDSRTACECRSFRAIPQRNQILSQSQILLHHRI